VGLLAWLCVSASACARAARGPAELGQAGGRSAAELHAAGLRFLGAGDLLRAEQYFASALQQGYDERACIEGLLVATVRASRLRSALAYARPALDRFPWDRRLRQLVASIHYALGELTQAARELARVLDQEEAQPEAHYLLWRVRVREGAAADLRREPLRRYLELAPAGPHAEEARAALFDMRAEVAAPAVRARSGAPRRSLREGARSARVLP
jgi:predicted Zn-dependent protease